MVLSKIRAVSSNSVRTFKNFGHKQQPVPGMTVLWHGFLTLTFIGLGIEWKKIAKFLFGDDHGVEEAPWMKADSPTTIIGASVDHSQ